MAVDLDIAVDVALGRLIAVMRSQLDTELAAVKTKRGYTALNLTGPVDYWTAFDDENVLELSQGAGVVAAFVYQVDESEVTSYITGAPDELNALVETEFGISIVYMQDLFEPFTYHGKTITTPEYMGLRAQMYNAGVISCLLKYASTSNDIERIELLQRMPPGYRETEEAGMIGVAECTFLVTQHTAQPVPLTGVI